MSGDVAKILLIIIALILGIHFLQSASSVVVPFAAAVVLAFFAYPLVGWMTAKKIPTWVAIVCVVLIVLGVLGGLGVVIQQTVSSFTENLPRYEERMTKLIQDVSKAFGVSKGELKQLSSGPEVKGPAAGVAASIIGTTLSFVENLFLVIFYLIFLLIERRGLSHRLDRALGPERRKTTIEVLEKIEAQSVRYIGLRTMLCLLTGAVVWAILAAYGVELALFWSVFSFVAQYVPIIGPIVASIGPILVALLQFPSPLTALWIGLWLTLWHLIVGYLLEPRIFGKGMHLNQALVLFSLFFFAWMWHAVGAVLAVPMLIALKIICDNVLPLKPLAAFIGEE